MPPASTRSASISSASTYGSKNLDLKKKFSCTFPACGKSFSRSEHLHRHALNHKEGTNTCLRCSAHFRRRDLLDRHMARHKEKDDEAGGEGLGVLATRKRLWRDAAGNIVNARRPSYTQDGPKRRAAVTRVEKKAPKPTLMERERKMTRGQAMMASLPSPTTTMSRNGSIASSTIIVDAGKYEYPDPEAAAKMEDDSWLDMHHLLSPPISEDSRAPSPATSLSDLDGLYAEAPWPLHHGLPPPLTSSSSAGSHTPPEFAHPTWSAPPQPQPFQTFMGAMAELPYDDIFKPEAGMYDWQHWNTQVLSRCREEKFEERKGSEWAGTGYPVVGGGGVQDGMRRTFGLGTC